MKRLSTQFISFIAAVVLFAPSVYAGTYSFSNSTNLVKGCPGNVDILIDTQGANVVAGDTTMLYDTNEITINQLNIGTPLPMQAFNQVGAGQLKLSGARLPFSGAFNGNAIFGSIGFTPSLTASSGTISFLADLVVENNMVDENIQNVLTTTTSKTYNFANRYNIEVDGIGFCTPDTSAPTVQLINPPNNSTNNPINTNIIFTMSDNRAGVDINSLNFTVNGVNYNQSSSEVTVGLDAKTYRIETNPTTNFSEGASIPVKVNICDKNTPANCTTQNFNFYIFEPAPPAPVCGNGIFEPSGGEQCDDGNLTSGDGCSSLCLTEGIEPPPVSSCNDGIQSPGEEGIDCGGNCQACILTCQPPGVVYVQSECETPQIKPSAPEKKLTICHFPDENPKNKYNLEINENGWETHEKHGDTKGPCEIKTEKIAKVTKKIEPKVEEKKPLPKEYVSNITTKSCETKAPFQSIEILQPENRVVSSELTPEISGSVTKNAEKVVIWRTKLDKNGNRIIGEKRTEISELRNFKDYPSVDNCDVIAAYKNYTLKNYNSFNDNSNYLVEAEAFYSEESNNDTRTKRSIISAINIAFNTGAFPEPPTQLSLDGKPIPKESIAIDANGNKTITLNVSWLSTAYAEDGSRQPFTIENAQPIISGKTESDARVFAIWNSNTVLMGSVISDEKAGSFNILAPRPLDKSIDHTVNVYAVKTNTSNEKLRSPGVTVHFKIKEKSLIPIIFIIGIFSLLILLLIIFHRKIYKKLNSLTKVLTQSEKIDKAKKITNKLLKK